MARCDFNKAILQVYWNLSLPWVFCCEFAAYFENTLSQEPVWRAASISCNFTEGKDSNTSVF